jgi:Flp pilus assembly protein TadD
MIARQRVPSRKGCGISARRAGWAAVCGILLTVHFGRADEFSDATGWMKTGEYEKVVAVGAKALQGTPKNGDWALLQGRALLTLGRYPEAREMVTNALTRWSGNLRLRWLAREVLQANGDTAGADAMVRQIHELISDQPWAYREPANLLAFGRAALVLGADPKQVLERVFDPIKAADPKLRDLYEAKGELALSKHDFPLAAKAFQEGLAVAPDDPDFEAGLAQAYAGGDQPAMVAALHGALKTNPRHVPSLLLLADHRIDAEDYAEASSILDEIKAVNPWHPDMWSYRAVLATLNNDAVAAASARASGLRFWTNNPRVDHLIGLKLSQKYRFAEGATFQRLALAFDGSYLPAKAQLANDLLRFGDEAGGWRLAREVYDADAYDANAYNLVTLRDVMAKWTAVTNADFVVRMAPREAAVFGGRVLDLLGRAQKKLADKYGLTPQAPTYVEIFPSHGDFGVRTFGMPDNPGFLGVCFGRVITATSPSANTAGATSWEAVLWHEFCHVITLQMTHNKMPRWLSEGISVYEELQEDPTWGQRMTPRYREMVLGKELTPVSKLSGAFLAPESPLHLQFAYYESCLVVEYIVRQFGADALKSVLHDLGDGVPINTALEKHTVPMKKLESGFAAFARERAETLAPLDWTKPSPKALAADDPAAVAAYLESHPTNYWALRTAADKFLADRRWADAKSVLERLLRLYPGQTGGDSPWPAYVAALHGLGATNEEQTALAHWAAVDAEAAPAFLRLMEKASASGDFTGAAKYARRYLAINPLVEAPYATLAEAAEAAGDTAAAAAACRAQLLLETPNPAPVHLRLARSLKASGDPAARREVLLALEDAPRDERALQLLLELNVAAKPTSKEPKP